MADHQHFWSAWWLTVRHLDATGETRRVAQRRCSYCGALEALQSDTGLSSLGVGAVEVETPTHAGKSPTPGSPPPASDD
jgi:hypothetical protein